MNAIDFKTLFNHEDYAIFGVIVLTLLLLYFFISGTVTRSRMTNDQKRRFIGNIRGTFFFVAVASIFALWATELYQFTISIAAFFAAMAIAGKEVILCFGGTFYRAFARPFSVGNRIEIDGIRGDIVDVGLLSTQLLEVGPKDYTQQLTGRMITIPNSLFLTKEVFNETDALTDHQDFVLHVIKVPIKLDRDWEKHRDTLLNAANEVCGEYIEPATAFFKRLAKKRHVDVPLIAPRINIKFDEPEKIFLMVRVCIPVDKKGTVQQLITRDYLKKTYP